MRMKRQASTSNIQHPVQNRLGFANARTIAYSSFMFVQTKHRFSVKEYYRMAETGVLRPEARVELLNGEIKTILRVGSQAAPLAFPDAVVDVAELLKR